MLILGSELKKDIIEDIKTKVIKCITPPSLKIIQVGNNPASDIYIQKKIELAAELNISATVKKFPDNADNHEVINVINEYNDDPSVHGIIIQLPLPTQIDTIRLLNTVSPNKDVDCLTFLNQGRLFAGIPNIIPCTPKAVLYMVKSVIKDITGAHVVIIGRSSIVGKPLAHLFLMSNCSVTVLHSHSKGIAEISSSADILVSATGQPKLVTEKFVKTGAIVIDVGISRVNGKIAGDVDFEHVEPKALAITPVPKGVGPMTVTMLMQNVVEAAISNSFNFN